MKLSKTQERVVRLAVANWPRSVPVKASDKTILLLERKGMIAASRFFGGASVGAMPKAVEWVSAKEAR